MNTHKRHLIILLELFCLLSLNSGLLKAQGSGGAIDVFFRLDYHDVVFTSNGYCDYMDWDPATGRYRYTDHSTFFDQPRFIVDGNHKYRISTGGNWTTHTITIQTVNLVPVPSGTTNQGLHYDITLEGVMVDRSALANPLNGSSFSSLSNMQTTYSGAGANTNQRATFFAGDDTVDVTITLDGDNVFKGEPGPHSVIEYSRFDAVSGVWKGTTGTGKLVIQEKSGGSGSLTIVKDGTHNGGAGIGCIEGGGSDNGNVSSGAIQINSGTISVTMGDYNATNGNLHGSFAAAIGGGAACRCGDITINGGTITATSCGTSAVIGAGGGYGSPGCCVSGVITINGGNITTKSKGNDVSGVMGVGIGAGSSHQSAGGGIGGDPNYPNGKIVINGGTVNVQKLKWGTTNTYIDGDIGGGNSNLEKVLLTANGGDAKIAINGGTVYAANIGGGGANAPDKTGGNATLTIGDASHSGANLHISGVIGGGYSKYANGGNATITVSKGTINAGSIGGGNSTDASTTGDGGDADVTITGGNFTIDGKIGGGKSFGSGAGGNASVHITGGSLTCASIGGGDSQSGTPGAVYKDASTAGIYIQGGSLTTGFIGGGTNLTTGAVGRATAKITAGTVTGQFVLANTDPSTNCYFTMTGGTIDNTGLGGTDAATRPRLKPDGGAVYIDDPNGVVTIQGNSTIQNCTGSERGGAIYANGGSITIQASGANSPQFLSNSANNGGALYINGGSCTITSGSIGTSAGPNTATTSGGGIYANGGSISFSNGTIGYNSAGTSGGGIFVSTDGQLTMTGTSTITRNHVPSGMHGGGVYLEGVVTIGNSSKATITAQDNYAGSSYDYVPGDPEHNNRNNIYLPSPTVNNDHKDVITVVKNGLTTSTSVGFSVPGNFVPVIYCDENSPYTYLESFLTPVASGGMKETVFDDAEKYHTVHFTFNPYDAQHIYLSSGTWVEQVTSQPSAAEGFSVDDNNVTISSEVGLAWLIRYINGISPVTQTHAGVNVTLTKDLNMGDYPWVPMASKAYSDTDTDVPFTGTFNGQGHTIANLDLQWLGAQTGTDLGLFGNIGTNGTVKNVSLKDASITTADMTASNGSAALGSIAGRTSGGTVMNCTASATLTTTNTDAVLGGLVGQIASGTVHSSYALPELTGYQMGGLAGSNSGNLYNSFANPQFTYSGAANAYFVGGLVAVNTGQVENCYVRLSRTPQGLTGAKFGMLAGSNSGTNTIVQCYAPDGASSQFSHSYTYLYNNDATGLSNCDLYKKVDAPYLYNRPNDNLVGSTGKVLYEKLNEWVSSKISSNSSLAYWKRTTAGGYSTSTHSGNINDDYPILMMKDLACAASPDGLFIEYGYSLDDIIMKYNGLSTGGTVWVYATPLSVYGSTDPDDAEAVSEDNLAKVKLYIDEDATLLQADGNSLTAFTSQTLRKNPTTNERWHFASSSLTSSTIGFSYGSDGVGFSWATNPCGVSFSTDNDNALFPGDLTSANITSVDLYCFYEPEYHWLNLKRNTNSHWHMNATTTPIVYNGNGTGGNGNETYLIPGKGYLMSIDKDQLLQNQGTLNTGSVTLRDVTYTTANEWAGLLGYNLLGNPYQSYLHFGSFVAGNGSLYASKDGGEATYATYDPEVGGYVQYKAGASRGSLTAGDLIHPHQGFLIRRSGGSTNVNAEFTDGMRRTALNGSASFRGEQPAYPLINLMVTDDEGDSDIAVLELDRDNDEGAEKLRTNTCKGWIYLHNDNEDYAVLFRTAVEDYQPLWFETEEAGTYTLSWSTANGDFESLTLVDNITGVKTDMLGRDSYVFEADPEQYASRFKIVIGDYKDIEENNEDGPSTGSETFAFQMGNELVVNGEGRLEVIDMLGRIVRTEQLQGSQSTVRKPETAGVYVLRLTGRDGVRTQKIVIR